MSVGSGAARDDDARRGLVYGLLAYGMWGFFPLYWHLLAAASPLEVLGYRIVGTFVLLGAYLAVRRQFLAVRAIDGRQFRLLAGAALLIAVNWLVYIWAVMRHHVVETSLGYFINPLVTVLLAVVVLRERVNAMQRGAIAVAALAVALLTWDLGRAPWIALSLAVTFAGYGLLKKRAAVPSLSALFIETALVSPPALLVVVGLQLRGEGSFGAISPTHDVLLLASSFVTALPLLAFGAAANRLPLVTIGLLQYLAPCLQFLCGVVVLGEAMSPWRWAGFGLVWASLTLFASDSIRSARLARLARLDLPL